MIDLKTVTVDINSIHEDPANARLHTTDQLEHLSKSLERFGQQKPIVVGKDNVIIAGNGTYEAAKTILGWKTISVVYSELSTEEARAYGLADNQIADQSRFDLDVLTQHIQELSDWNPMQDWESIGFTNDIVESMLDSESDEESANTTEPEPEKNDKPEMGKSIKVTEEMRETIDQAVNIVRLQEKDYTMTEGRAIELIAADFLSGVVESKEEEL